MGVCPQAVTCEISEILAVEVRGRWLVASCIMSAGQSHLARVNLVLPDHALMKLIEGATAEGAS